MKPIVAIVGRPNVGKSTLFNRIIGRRKAIVADEPGVTRDLNFGDAEELGHAFTVVDTGGFEADTTDEILKQVRDQARLAIEDSDVIVFLMDGRVGPTPQDKDLVDMLRRSGKPVIYAVNKLDTDRLDAGAAEFYGLGIGQVLPVSAEHGRGLNELIDGIIEKLPPAEEEEAPGERVSVAIVGRPNAGKSSLLNRLIGRQRSIVSDVAGTTRDSIDTPFESDGRKYLFIDTAGIRKKNKISLTVESYCVMEAIKSIERCDAAVLVVDGHEGVKAQDEKIAGLIEDRKKCCVIVVNKWDLVEKDTHTAGHAEDFIRKTLPFLTYAPVIFTSALTGQRVKKVLDTIDEVVEKGRTRVSTSKLNDALEGIQGRYHPPAYKGKEVKFYYMTQTGVMPPTFVVFANIPEGVQDQYKRYLAAGLRETLGMENVPIKLIFRKRH
ncbi:MAG: ribosome biogenesis GTPase Der [Deltaproteobacteria bacterium]|nr:ribosome biogenesis GTPase Der [Deltaproteobacteria bacterium]